MANYRLANSTENTSNPPIEALRGGQLAKKDRVMSAFANPQRLLGNNFRVIGRVGLHGSDHMQVVSADPDSGAVQLYPLANAERVAFRQKWSMSPGSRVVVSVLALPTGMTSKYVDEPGSWIGDVADGRIIAEATFTGPGGAVVVSDTMKPKISNATFAAEHQSTSAAWMTAEWMGVGLRPSPDNLDAENLYDWSEGVTCDLVIKYRGGIRVIDLVVIEESDAYVRDIGTDSHGEYMLPMTVDQIFGKPTSTYPRDYPVSALTATDPTYGTELLADVVDRQHREPGHVIASWTAWDETSQPVDELDVVPVSTSSTTFVALPQTALTVWNEDYPGWSASSGGSCQQYKSSNARRELRGTNATIPVRIWLYAWRTGGASAATVRLQSESYSVTELLVSSNTPGWRSATGYIKCGLGAEDATVLMLFGKVPGVGYELNVSHMVVEYVDL